MPQRAAWHGARGSPDKICLCKERDDLKDSKGSGECKFEAFVHAGAAVYDCT